MIAIVLDELNRLVAMTNELADNIPSSDYERSLPDRSNTVGAQLWCVVGGRESYGSSIAAGSWSGFHCSLESPGDKEEVVEILKRSGRELSRLGEIQEWTKNQQQLLIRLLEHEAQHHGQLIRFAYTFAIRFPETWKTGWALDD